MRIEQAFEQVIEPSIERIPLIETQHVERHDGLEYIVAHTLRRNVFTAFDTRLSKHLAAVYGAGFPSVSVEVRIRQRDDAEGWRRSSPSDYPSVPHALHAIGKRAIGTGKAATLRLYYEGFFDKSKRGDGIKKVIRDEDLEVLKHALKVCQIIGEPAFLDISGDYDLVTVQPLAANIKPVLMDLIDRRLAVPPIEGMGYDPISAPLFDFERVQTENADARAYMATVRHSMTSEKEAAVHNFRGAAEERIFEFDRALAGRDLAFHRLDAVVSLVTRLRAGLGDDLKGISEDARLRALDWAETIEEDAGAHRPYQEREPHPKVTVDPSAKTWAGGRPS